MSFTESKKKTIIDYTPKRGGGTPYNGLCGEARPKRGTFFRLQVHERVGISVVEVYGREGNLSFGLVKGPKRAHI